jgi:hypothetical protein
LYDVRVDFSICSNLKFMYDVKKNYATYIYIYIFFEAMEILLIKAGINGVLI